MQSTRYRRLGVGSVVLLGAALSSARITSGQERTCTTHELKKLTSDDVEAADAFGYSVAVSDDVAVVGAWNDTWDPVCNKCGSAYVFERNHGGMDNWGQVAKLTTSDSDPAFTVHVGWSVSISQDVVVVGTPNGVFLGVTPGAAYVFEKPSGGWVDMMETEKLVPAEAPNVMRFGWAVSVSGDLALVGALDGSDGGAAYVYRREGVTWVEERKLRAFDPQVGDQFGRSVSISGDVAVVSALSGECPVGEFLDCGSAYVFRRYENSYPCQSNVDCEVVGLNTCVGKVCQGIGWDKEQELYEGMECFGSSVSVSDDVAMVGAYWDSGICGRRGSVYVYRFDGNMWALEDQLMAPPEAGDHDGLGFSVSLDGDVAVVSSASEDCGGSPCRVVYIYRFNGKSWELAGRLHDALLDPLHFLGHSVAISGDVAVVGALGDASAYAYGVECAARDIPALSEWGLAVMTLLVLAAGTVVLRRRRVAPA